MYEVQTDFFFNGSSDGRRKRESERESAVCGPSNLPSSF